jgi:hypothetical protein
MGQLQAGDHALDRTGSGAARHQHDRDAADCVARRPWYRAAASHVAAPFSQPHPPFFYGGMNPPRSSAPRVTLPYSAAAHAGT